MDKKLKILFLGAGKLLTLLEHFIKSAQKQTIEIELYSFELNRFCSIGKVATIIESPKFVDQSFPEFLLQFVNANKIDIIIPTMDSATVVLSSFKKQLEDIGCFPVVSNYNLCNIMHDKLLSDEWFEKNNIDRPLNSTAFPKVAKPRFGYASKGIAMIKNQDELRAFESNNDLSQYLIQDFIVGDEYTVDSYVSKNGEIIDILTRKRVEVEAGIVNTSLTERNESIIEATRNILSINGWYGPITLQFFYSGNKPVIIEVNPRFGGGVTHSLHCGLDMPTWIFNEFFDKTIFHKPGQWKDGVLMTRCRRDIFYDNCN